MYLAANSGAKFGLAQELRELIRVAWLNEDDPTKGFQYVYLTDEDHAKMMQVRQTGGIKACVSK